MMGNGTGERYANAMALYLGSGLKVAKTKKWWEYIILCWIHIFFHYQRLLITCVSAQFAINMVKLVGFFIIFRIRLDTVVDATTLGWHCVVTFILHNQTMQSGKALKKKNNSKDINIIFFLSAGKHLTGVTLYE